MKKTDNKGVTRPGAKVSKIAKKKTAKPAKKSPQRSPKFAIRDTCFKCGKPIVRMTDEKMRKQFGGVPITAIVSEHYVTPWGPACRDCLPDVEEMWMKYRQFMTGGGE